MRYRLVPKNEVKKAYEKEYKKSKLDVKDSREINNIDKVPEELFLILSKTLSFVEQVDKGEE